MAQPRFETGIEALEQGGLAEEAASHRLLLGSCYWSGGRRDLARRAYETVKASLENRKPSEQLARAYERLALLDVNAQEVESALAMADQAIRTAEAVGADAPRLSATMFRGAALVGMGSVDAGLLSLDRSWREAMEKRLYDVAGQALSNAINLRTWCCRVSETTPLFAELQSIPDLVHLGGRLATWVCYRKAVAGIVLGEMPGARAAATEGLRLAQEADSLLMLVPELKVWLAVAERALGRIEEARTLVPDFPLRLTGDDVEAGFAAMRVWLDLGENERAVGMATRALEFVERSRRLVVQDVWLIDKAIEVFLAAQMAGEAERLSRRAQEAPAAIQPLRDRVEGRMALWRGDLPRADAHLSGAAQLFQDASCRDDEWRTRRVLAEVKALRGDRASAEGELQLVMAGADAHGHHFEATAARRQLAELELLPLDQRRGISQVAQRD